MGNFRLNHIEGVDSKGIQKIKFSKIYTEATSNKVRTANGGENDILKTDLKRSVDTLGLIENADKIIVEKMPDGRYLVVNGNHTFSVITEDILPDGKLDVEVVKFANGDLGTRARLVVQMSTNIPLPQKRMSREHVANQIYQMGLAGLLNINDDQEIKEIINQIASWMGDDWKRKVRNDAKKMSGVPLEFVSQDKKQTKKVLADNGIGTEFAYNHTNGMYETVLRSESEWRTMGRAIQKFMKSEGKTKTSATLALSKAPARGDFKAARELVKTTCEEQFNAFRDFFMEYGLDAELSEFLEFTGKALPQDGLNEMDEVDNHTLIDC
tara:strand:+ start:239 stop:1213 length:975 start_codon:yes stop_codon:yes gene_type:complete